MKSLKEKAEDIVKQMVRRIRFRAAMKEAIKKTGSNRRNKNMSYYEETHKRRC